jgi:hypothetical protein
MIGLTTAIGDFMTVLAESALWEAAGIALQVAAGAGVVGGGFLMVRKWRRKARHEG